MSFISDPKLSKSPKISKRKITKKLTEADIMLGKQIRELRTLRGHSQVKIAKAIGITFQQFQKYECGINRICMSRIFEICKYCNVVPSYFIDTIYNNYYIPKVSLLNQENFSELSLEDSATEKKFEYDSIDNKEILMLIRLFNSIKDASVRKKALSLLKVLANESLEDVKT